MSNQNDKENLELYIYYNNIYAQKNEVIGKVCNYCPYTERLETIFDYSTGITLYLLFPSEEALLFSEKYNKTLLYFCPNIRPYIKDDVSKLKNWKLIIVPNYFINENNISAVLHYNSLDGKILKLKLEKQKNINSYIIDSRVYNDFKDLITFKSALN